jgi:hypothetical protein
MEKLQDTVNEKVQDELKNYQDTSNKKTWEDKETSKWTQRDFNKHQSETKRGQKRN